ncbi:hypothetical protein [Chamaesiphon sp.]|uniref:hypothetical protein n=1 Tax=Chamaesiphon sp. TaxID=2814140 RepID=UPI00359440F4
MKLDIYEFRHIVNNIGDLLFISGCHQPINISVELNDDAQNNIFMKLAFPLLNGNSEIRIYQSQAFFLYLGATGEVLKQIEFNNSHLREVHGSFNTTLKQILVFDRQHSDNQAKRAETSIDRASFGLAEVN